MLNPKVIEVYGERNRDTLNKLVEIVGTDVAETFRIALYDRIPINGGMLPGLIFTTLNSNVTSIANSINDFVDDNTPRENERYVIVYNIEELKDISEEVEQLWLSSN